MSNFYIVIALVFVAVYIIFFMYMQNKRKKLVQAFADINIYNELQHADQYKEEALRGDHAFIRTQLKDKNIDTFTVAAKQHTGKDMAKDVAKDALKSMATLGTVRYTTVQTPKYLVLSGDELHLLDIDTDGDVDRHLIFDRDRLEASELEEIPLTKVQAAQAKGIGAGELLKSYKLSLKTASGFMVLNLYNMMLAPVITPQEMFTQSGDKMVRNYVIGLDFLNRLGEKYRNLKIYM
ncbi:MAG: hypothetical protein EOP54_09245 [Sphingobacteriales bacterium]|nr:MAG: hypothetical protein EOP54_09245 [Sphingobacteriales bacterium]